MKPLFNRITIVGVGLLGGSIGLAVKKSRIAREVVGHFRNPAKIAAAVKSGAVDRGTTDLKEAIRDSDLIILATPVSDIMEKLRLFRKWHTKTLITDTGSTKIEIMRTAGPLSFVGSHPIAGSEHSGLTFARGDLFKKSLCLLTPCRPHTPSARKVTAFWKALGARVMDLSAEKHDRILSFSSHLPHAVAFSLMNTVDSRLLNFAGGGLKDTTRIAASSPDLWVDIFISNKKELLKALTAFEKNIARFRQDLTHHPRILRRTLAAAKKKRDRWTHAA